MTTDWTAGYVADINYTFGYYRELNPLRSRFALLNAGLAPPAITTACELGFGQGLSTNIHASASTVQWSGTDFNPGQAAFAQELAGVSGAGARLFDEAFAEFTQRQDLPDFDFIGLHGIWSWISDANRTVIVDFLRRKLKPGGVLYISYNTQPGWAGFAPMRHLMTGHGATMGSAGRGIVGRIDDALDFADRLLKTNPRFAAANPQVTEKLESIKKLDRHYLAHEYFNRDWHPMHFATMAEWLAPAKLTFACSAYFPDFMDHINLTAEQLSFLQEIPDPQFRESVRDFMVNQQFRRDYWVRGPRALSPLDHAEGLRSQRMQLTQLRSKVKFSFSTARGEATLDKEIQGPILDLLADYKPRSLGQMERDLAGRPNIKLAHIKEALVLLGEANSVSLAQDEESIAGARKQSDLLNAEIMKRARGSTDIGFFASPVTGGGVPVSRFHQLFAMALSQGRKTPRDWAQSTWEILSLRSQKLVKDGKTLESAEDNLAELLRQAEDFAAQTLPVLQGLRVI